MRISDWSSDVCSSDLRVWMSHGDSVTAAPAGFDVLASTDVTPVAAFEDLERKLAGVQWHPEVMHSEHGQATLEHFLHDIAGCRRSEERRVGKERVSTCRSRGEPDHEKKNR